MPLSLADAQAINQLADQLYPFLPGKPHPYADPRISFKGIAKDLRIGRFWRDGSKLPAISELLSCTFQADKARFATLVLETVRRGMLYREGKDPVRRLEIEALNETLLRLRMKVKELHDPNFLSSLPGKARSVTKTDPGPTTPQGGPPDSETLKKLGTRLTSLAEVEPRRRGFAFESFLNELFAAFSLAPRGSFRLIGEQIDGSFYHAGHTYLLEAKWQAEPIGQADLLVFWGKVGGKAQWSRGVHMSLSGYSSQGLDAFARGKQTNFICFDGLDLHSVLQGKVDLRDLIISKTRIAAESNAAFTSVRDLIPGVI